MLIKVQEMISKSIIIGNDIWIVRRVAVLTDIGIKDVAVIGANSVVTKSTNKNSGIHVWMPARLIKERS